MIVVTGEPRSGTSLMMRIVRALGFTIAGVKYIDEHTKTFNPTGIWEVNDVTHAGIQEEREEDVIKLSTRGLIRSNPKVIDKYILCIRDPREVIVSQRQMKNPHDDAHNLNLYLGHMTTLLEKRLKMQCLIVDYGDVMWGAVFEVERVARFLGVPYKTEATQQVKPELYRTKKHQAKRCKLMKAAEKYYQALRYCIK